MIGNLAWMFHVFASSKLDSPLDHILHYPLPVGPVPGFENCLMTISNYAGLTRDYVRTLIETCGSKFDGSMTKNTSYVVSASYVLLPFSSTLLTLRFTQRLRRQSSPIEIVEHPLCHTPLARSLHPLLGLCRPPALAPLLVQRQRQNQLLPPPRDFAVPARSDHEMGEFGGGEEGEGAGAGTDAGEGGGSDGGGGE